MLHLTAHHDLRNVFLAANLDQAGELPERYPVTADSQRLDLGQPPPVIPIATTSTPAAQSCFQGEHREAAITGDETVGHNWLT